MQRDCDVKVHCFVHWCCGSLLCALQIGVKKLWRKPRTRSAPKKVNAKAAFLSLSLLHATCICAEFACVFLQVEQGLSCCLSLKDCCCTEESVEYWHLNMHIIRNGKPFHKAWNVSVARVFFFLQFL